jgi:hypothetical protein
MVGQSQSRPDPARYLLLDEKITAKYRQVQSKVKTEKELFWIFRKIRAHPQSTRCPASP